MIEYQKTFINPVVLPLYHCIYIAIAYIEVTQKTRS